MSRRFLAAVGTLVVFFGISGIARAQDEASAGKEKAAAKPAASGDEKSVPAADKAPADPKPEEKAASSKARSSGAKARAKKANGRQPGFGRSQSDEASGRRTELATFGGGCFWHVEADFERLEGVISAVSGYAGGQIRNPSYEMVHEGFTGHAEVVMVQFDPDVISYEDLLKVFWTHHDPTTPNRQGPDVGTQYRSIIFYHNEAQKKAALKSYDQLVEARAFRNPIVTQLEPLRAFYRAEDEHQDYYGGKPRASSRRRTTSSTKAKKPLSKAAKALEAKPAEDQAEEARTAEEQGKEAKPEAEPAGGKSPG